MSKNDATEMDKVAVRKCSYKGCKKTSNECIIKCKGCPEHYEIMKERARIQRANHFRTQTAKKAKLFHHKIGEKELTKSVGKELSYEKHIIRKASFHKGELVAMSNSHGTIYKSLKAHGVCLIPDLVRITNKAFEEFIDVVNKEANKFETMFTDITKGGKTKEINGDGPNRWILKGENTDFKIGAWSDFEDHLLNAATDAGFPVKGRRDPKVEFDYNIFKTDANLKEVQIVHTDEYEHNYFRNNSKTFSIVSITAISESSLLYVQPYDGVLKPVLLERGDTLFFRTDIAHAGAENVTDYPNYRVHAFWKVEGWNDNNDDDVSVKRVDDVKQMSIYWNPVTCKYGFDKDV